MNILQLPECKGRTYGELDVLFEKRIRAKKFRKYAGEAYEDPSGISSSVGLNGNEV